MKYWIALVLLFCVGCLGTFSGVLFGTPFFVMKMAERHLAQVAGGYNTMVHGQPPTARTQAVVRPSPDQIYSLCVFNLEKGPVVFTGRVPETYFSLSLYADDTDVFFVVNDRELSRGQYRFVLIGKNAGVPEGIDAARVIRSPSLRGVAFTRMLVPTRQKLDNLQAIQKSSSCHPL